MPSTIDFAHHPAWEMVRVSGGSRGPTSDRFIKGHRGGKAGRENGLISGGSRVNRGRHRGALSLTHTDTHRQTVMFTPTVQSVAASPALLHIITTVKTIGLV